MKPKYNCLLDFVTKYMVESKLLLVVTKEPQGWCSVNPFFLSLIKCAVSDCMQYAVSESFHTGNMLDYIFSHLPGSRKIF